MSRSRYVVYCVPPGDQAEARGAPAAWLVVDTEAAPESPQRDTECASREDASRLARRLNREEEEQEP